MVVNVGLAIGILLIYHPAPKTQCTPGLASHFFRSGSPTMSDNVRDVAIGSGMVENVCRAVGISLISHPMPMMQCTSGLPLSVLTSGCPALSGNVRLCH